jgi:hypothetical protein
MALEVIGAGAGRTGTQSLKVALERLLDGPCYDMWDLMKNPHHVPVWERALTGEDVDWDLVFADHRATVDWTAASFYGELARTYPDAIVVLSVRDPDDWWRSVNRTVFEALRTEPPDDDTPIAQALAPARRFTLKMLSQRFTADWSREDAAKEAFRRHNEDVRAAIPADRLVEWRPGDGWEPLCGALRVPVPAEPFPHVWTTDDFRSALRLDPAE